MKRFADKMFIVTGCTGGIGNAVCRRLRNEDAFIVGINVSNGKKNPFVHEQLTFDLGSLSETENNLNLIFEEYGAPDCLVHCSGSLIPGLFKNLKYDEIKFVLDANLFSLFNIIKTVLPVMEKNKTGHIVVVGSLGGIVPMPYSALYSSMKFAVRGFCLSLSEELKDNGISLSLISPGPVDTNMLRMESSDDNAFTTFVQKPMSPEYAAKRIISVIQKPSLETVFPVSGQSAILGFGLFSKTFYKILKIMKQRGIKGLELYRKNLSVNTTG
jgi:short-subunit dehydrogenase